MHLLTQGRWWACAECICRFRVTELFTFNVLKNNEKYPIEVRPAFTGLLVYGAEFARDVGNQRMETALRLTRSRPDILMKGCNLKMTYSVFFSPIWLALLVLVAMREEGLKRLPYFRSGGRICPCQYNMGVPTGFVKGYSGIFATLFCNSDIYATLIASAWSAYEGLARLII
jgi:hypothetical protein